MSSVVIFLGEHGVSIMRAADCGLTIREVAQKDVPAGVPFWIVNDEDLPSDVPQEAWELDEVALGEPDGIGGTYREVASND